MFFSKRLVMKFAEEKKIGRFIEAWEAETRYKGGKKSGDFLRGGHLASGHGLGDEALKSQFLLLQVFRGRVLDLELAHGVAQSRLDLLLVATLELKGHGGVGDDFFNARDVGLKLLARLKLLGESLIARLELGSIWTCC